MYNLRGVSRPSALAREFFSHTHFNPYMRLSLKAGYQSVQILFGEKKLNFRQFLLFFKLRMTESPFES